MSISFYVKSDSDFLNSVMWIPEKSRDEGVVFCHGWGGGTPYDDLLKTLADRGYTVLRFEQRGYGNSTGRGDLMSLAGGYGGRRRRLKRRSEKSLGRRPVNRRNHGLGGCRHSGLFFRCHLSRPVLQLAANSRRQSKCAIGFGRTLRAASRETFSNRQCTGDCQRFKETNLDSARDSRRIGSLCRTASCSTNSCQTSLSSDLFRTGTII